MKLGISMGGFPLGTETAHMGPLLSNLKHKLEVLRSHCEDIGRDYGAIEKTVSTFVDPDADRTRVLAHLAELADLGIDHAMVSPRQPWEETTLDQVAAIVPDAHAIPVGG